MPRISDLNALQSCQQLPAEAAGEAGQTMVEYGVLISLISVALLVVIGVTGFGGALTAYYENILATIAALT